MGLNNSVLKACGTLHYNLSQLFTSDKHYLKEQKRRYKWKDKYIFSIQR